MSRTPKESLDKVQETRQTIIRTAHKLFMQYGYRAVSTRQIADSCGLTQPALYHHFSNKQSLYIEVIRETVTTTRTALERIIKRPISLHERLREIVYYMMLNSPEDLNQMFHDIRQELSEDLQSMIEKWWKDGYLYPITSLFEEGRESGFFSKGEDQKIEIEPLTYLFLGFVRSAMNPGSKKPVSSQFLKVMADQLVDIFLFGVASDLARVQYRS